MTTLEPVAGTFWVSCMNCSWISQDAHEKHECPRHPDRLEAEIDRLKAENASLLESLRQARDGAFEKIASAELPRLLAAAEQRAEAAEKETGGLRIALDQAEHDAQIAEAQTAAAEKRSADLMRALRKAWRWLIDYAEAGGHEAGSHFELANDIRAALHDEERSAPGRAEPPAGPSDSLSKTAAQGEEK